MPNLQNIDAPITLFGYGRSGTSLLFNIFMRHPDVFAVGETGPLIFGAWEALETSLGNCAQRLQADRPMDPAARCVESVRLLMLHEFPSNERCWMHKPIGIPGCVSYRIDPGAGFPDFASWYWNAFESLFPRAKCLFVLRNPYDVALSAFAYSQTYPVGHPLRTISLDAIVRELTLVNRLVAQCQLPMLIIDFNDLADRPQAAVQEILQFCGLHFYETAMCSFRYRHAAHVGSYGKEGNETRKSSEEFSRAEDYPFLQKTVDRDLLEQLVEVTNRLRPGLTGNLNGNAGMKAETVPAFGF